MRSGLGVGVVVLVAVTAGWCLSQDKPKTARKPMPKKKPIANTEALDTKVSQAEAAFVRETEGLAGQYFDAGHYDKAETLLKKIEAIEPNRPGVREKLKIISDTQLAANEMSYDLRVHPRDRLEFAWPVGLVVWPAEPGRRVRLPLGGHAGALSHQLSSDSGYRIPDSC